MHLTPTALITSNLPDHRIADIEVLRAIAILMVLVQHMQHHLFTWRTWLNTSNLFWHGAAGVDLFFAVSGFVIARSLLPRLRAIPGGPPFLAATSTFLLQRFWRLQPSAWLWILLPAAMSFAFNRSGAFDTPHTNLSGGLAAVLGVYNFQLGWQNGWSTGGIVFPYWSLSLEEQFYLLLPLAALIFREKIALVMMSLILYQFFLAPTLIANVTRPGAIAGGVLLAIWSVRPSYSLGRPAFLARAPARLLFLVSALLAMGALESEMAEPLFSTAYGLIAVISAALVYTASFDCGYIMAPGGLRRVFLWIGSRSYAIYLTHVPAFALTRELFLRLGSGRETAGAGLEPRYLAMAFLLTAALSELNFRYVETPGRRYGRSLRITAAGMRRRGILAGPA